MWRILKLASYHVFCFIVPDRWRLAMRYGWRELGAVNQLLVVFAGFFLVTISYSIYMMASKSYKTREIKCLALNIYHEARGEPLEGKYAVGVVTMNRVRSPDYPDDVCRVVYQRGWAEETGRYIGAFSWTTDLHEDIPFESSAWEEAYDIAQRVYNHQVSSKAENALFYHADYVKPVWARNKVKIAKIGRHVFYQ